MHEHPSIRARPRDSLYKRTAVTRQQTAEYQVEDFLPILMKEILGALWEVL